MIYVTCRAAAEYSALDVSFRFIDAMLEFEYLSFRTIVRGNFRAVVWHQTISAMLRRGLPRGLTCSDTTDCFPRRHLTLWPRSMDTQANYDDKGK